MTTPILQRAPGAALRKECGRIIATLIRHTGNYHLSESPPRADATNRVPAPITHRGSPMNRMTPPEPPLRAAVLRIGDLEKDAQMDRS
jgi:hypothetical protein